MISVRAAAADLTTGARAHERTVRIWGLAVMGLLVGYLLLGRAFAYLGLPGPLPIFLGEIVLVLFFVFHPEASTLRWFSSMVRNEALSSASWALYASLAYGVVLTLRGVFGEEDALQAIQNLVFNVYPLYLFLGLWLGEHDRGFVRRFVLVLAWANAIYGILYIGLLNGVNVFVPGTSVFLFNAPQGQMIVLLGLLTYHSELRKVWFPLFVNFVILLGLQTRAHWAGMLLAVPVWAVLSRRLGRFVAAVTVGAILLGVAFVADVRLPSALTRGPTDVSARSVFGAAVAPFDEQTAAQYTEQAGLYSGTAEWRRDWWSDIWDSVHITTGRTLFGYGYGYYLKQTSDIGSGKEDLRTPHNVFFYALGYGGWVGVVLFGLVMITVGRLLWVAFRRTGDPFGLSVMFLGLGIGLFTNYFETPFAAIPYWLLLGLSAAPALRPDDGAAPGPSLASSSTGG